MPSPIGEDDDLVVGEVRQCIDGTRPKRGVAGDGQGQVHTNDDAAMAERPLDEAVNHGDTHSEDALRDVGRFGP